MKRNYLSIYFPYRDKKGIKTVKNVCVAFGRNEEAVYRRMKAVPSGEIKNTAGIHSYSQLIKIAEKENRKPSELIKLRFAAAADNRITKTVSCMPHKVRRWLSSLKRQNKAGADRELIKFLEGLLDKD